MRHALYLFALIVTLALVPVDRAHAQYRFGTDEQIHFIQDVPLKGAKDEALYLGYMTKTQNFLLGVSVEDAGYVLGVTGESGRFYHMPKGEELAKFQTAGTLPSPLPPYRLGIFDYVVGYSLWWGLALVALFWGIGAWRKRKAPEPANEAAPQA
ncbi:MAG: hypothetical protein ACJ8DN_18820 [Microvirga sp.]